MTRFCTLIAAVWLTIGVAAAEIPAPLQQALDEGAQYKDLHISFTMKADNGSDTIVMRYDQPGNEWTMLEGDLETMDKDDRKAIEDMQEDFSAPGTLAYDKMKENVADAALTEETGEAYIYTAEMLDDGKPLDKAISEAVTARLHLSKTDGAITRFEMSSSKPFKPAAVAKVDTLIVETDYERLTDGPPVQTRIYSRTTGSAFFKKFDEELTLEFYDFGWPPE